MRKSVPFIRAALFCAAALGAGELASAQGNNPFWTTLETGGGQLHSEKVEEAVSICMGAAKTTTEAQACIGKTANACGTGLHGGTTAGMARCVSAEQKFWQSYLEDGVADLLQRYEALEKGPDLFPHLPKQSDSLRDLHEAWLVYRVARCNVEAV